MDSNQLGIRQTSSGSTGAIQAVNPETATDSLSGFARLFSMIKNKADKLSHEQNAYDSAANGKTKPEFGKDLPLKYAGSHTTPDKKMPTAVLSTSAERTNAEIKKIGAEEILENGFIPPLEEKLNIQAKTAVSGATNMPNINLPQLGRTEEKLIQTESSIKAIAAADVISVQTKDAPAIASTNKITSIQNGVNLAQNIAVENSQKQSSNTESTETNTNEQKSLSSQAQTSQLLSSAHLSQARLNNSQPNSPVTINSKITESDTGLAGISALNRDLSFGQYSAASNILVKPVDQQILSTSQIQDPTQSAFNANPAAALQAASDNVVKENQSRSVVSPNIATSTVQQVELAQIEIGEKSILAQTANEKSLVEASFQRPFIDSKTAEIKAAEDKQFIKNVASHASQVAEVKLEDATVKAAQQQSQSFEEMWNKANSVEDLVNKTRMEQILGSRPATELSQAARGSILPASNIELPLSTKPSLATQTLFSVSSNSTHMPSPTLNFSQSGWEKSLAQNVSWMTGNNVKTLQVSITPAELGPIHIHASMEQDKLNLQVSAQNGVTRETLEAAIPRLRDLLDEGSYSSVNVDVSSGGFEQNQFSQNENIKEFDQASESELAELSAQDSAQTASKIGLVDTFA